MPRFRRPELLVLGVTFALGVALLWLAPRPGGTGLVGRYWDNSDWAGEPVVEALGAVPTAADVLGRFRGASVASSAEWSGYLVAEHAGTHRFVTESDDGSWLFVGERLVVDNGGQHENRVSEGTVDLEAGLHPIRIRYFQAGGDLSLGVYWIPPDGSQRRLMAEALVPSSAAAESAFGGWRWSTLVLAAPVLWSAVFVYLLARVGFSLVWRQVEQTAPERRDRRVVALVMAGGTLLAVWGIGWGLVGNSWAADELPAGFVRDLIANRLAGGWHDKYSQMHFMVLAVPVSTFVLAEHLWAAAADTVASQAAQLALMRLVSTVMA
ncbi:MAG TPA: PA14 domain-containing protein, partial [Vicinamibacterales bacterium]|nr:PA14 domain-containing protein [Vicinamibacterales bacterium]